MRILSCIVLLIISQLSYALTNQSSAERFQQILDQFRKQEHVASATLTITYPDGKKSESYMSGTTESNGTVPATANHLFQVGSITKSFIAVTLLNLQYQGWLKLDDPISLYLPEYPQWGGITIRQLLNHTSGIYNFTDSETLRAFLFTHPFDFVSTDEAIKYAEKEPLYFKTGHGWHYSNTNYMLLGKIIERLEAQPIDAVLDDYLRNVPNLSLENTFFIKHMYNDDIKSRMLHGYYALGPNDEIDTTNFSMSWLNAAGGIVSNGSDIAGWIRALFTGDILEPESLEELTSLVSITDGQPVKNLSEATPVGYGLGIKAWLSSWKNVGVIWWHAGGTTGYKSLMMWLPKQQIAIVISYTQVVYGKEAISLEPTSALAQDVLKEII